MSYFKNFSKTICNSRLTRPNNLILADFRGPHILLCRSNEPSVDHINTLKSLHNTINELSSLNDGKYKSLIDRELTYLNQSAENYKDNCRKYVENGGNLTAQGVANVYACAEQLQVNSEWLKKYVYEEIPMHVRNMSVANLQDLAEGLNKYHSGCEFLALVEKQLSTRDQSPSEYVKRAFNELSVFEETQKQSQNILLNVINKNGTSVEYYARKSIQYLHDWYNSATKRPHGYVLHE